MKLAVLSITFPWVPNAGADDLRDQVDVDRAASIFSQFSSARPQFRSVLVDTLTFVRTGADDDRWCIVSTNNSEERVRLSTGNASRRT